METTEPSLLHYKRSNFVTALPMDRRYSPSHCWLEERDGVWRVGFTRFATRMLGDPVDHRFDTPPRASVKAGDVLGWIEGFKAISDVFCVITGEFLGGNPALADDIELIRREGYGAGWLYEVRGQPDAITLDVNGYRDVLDRTIDRILEK